jgi:hypothetical protein
VISERDLLCSFELLRLDCFFLSFFLVNNSIVTEARDTNCVVVTTQLRLDRLVVVIKFVNFRFALFTPSSRQLSMFVSEHVGNVVRTCLIYGVCEM